MTLFRSTVLACFVAAACGGSSKPVPQQPPSKPLEPTAGQIDVAIGSVTLGEDCGGGPMTPPAASIAKPSTDFGWGDAPEGARSMSYSSMKRRCQQSSVQLRVTNGTAAATDISIKKVELVDASGQVVRELTAREPSKWNGDSYESWDGKVAPDGALQVSFALSDPSATMGTEYTVRVTIVSDGADKTLEQKATRTQVIEAPAELPPGAVT